MLTLLGLMEKQRVHILGQVRDFLVALINGCKRHAGRSLSYTWTQRYRLANAVRLGYLQSEGIRLGIWDYEKSHEDQLEGISFDDLSLSLNEMVDVTEMEIAVSKYKDLSPFQCCSWMKLTDCPGVTWICTWAGKMDSGYKVRDVFLEMCQTLDTDPSWSLDLKALKIGSLA